MTDDTFLLVGPLGETPITMADEYECDAVLCLGDLLRLAPPPDYDPHGSLLETLDEDCIDHYATTDVATIGASIRNVQNHPEFETRAERRYRALFSASDTPFYYIAGNQDVPDALTAAARQFQGVTHADNHDEFCVVDGAVPAFSDVPAGAFPCERSAEEFYRTIESSSASVVAAHTLPPEFEPSAYGFEAAHCATDGERSVSETVVRLPSYRRTGAVAELRLTGTTDASGTPTVEITEPDHTHVTPR